MSVTYADTTELAASPPARRGSRPSWREPRLLVGVLLICASVVAGAVLLRGADDTVAVWAAGGPLAAGQSVGPTEVVAVRVRFTSAADAERYLSADQPLPQGAGLARPVGAGELLPREALSLPGTRTLVQLPLVLDRARVPAGVRVGSIVDVWAGPGEAGQGAAELLLAGVPVLAAPRGGEVGGAVRQVVVGLEPDDQDLLAETVTRMGAGTLLLVLRTR